MHRTTRALILAAGEGKRLWPMTENLPKPMIPVNGKAMIDRAISALHQAGVDHFTIVAGHCEEVLRAHVARLAMPTRFEFVSNPRYRDTNSMFSLLLGLAGTDRDTWIVEADLLFEPDLFQCPVPFPLTWLVDRSARHLDGAFVDSDAAGCALAVDIVRDLSTVKPGAGKSVGVLHVAQDALGMLRNWLTMDVLERRENDYFDITLGRRLPCPDVGIADRAGCRWYEVDSHSDLLKAEALFS